MSNKEELEHESFQEDLDFLIKTLKESFESTEVQYFVDEHNDMLFVKLEGLDEYSEQEIEEIASPIFDVLDLDFEEIVLLPL